MTPEKIHALIQDISRCNATPGEGVTRFSYSAEDRRAKDLVLAELKSLGCETYVDWAGNVHGLLPGAKPDLPAVMVGSHLDSVRNGGRFDGIVGVVGGLAVIERLKKSGATCERPVRFVAFAEEEGSNFSVPLLGSKAFIGKLTPVDLEAIATPEGRCARDVVSSAADASGDAPEWAGPGNIECMLELHVEQGGSLHDAGVGIGVVDVIAADVVMTVRLSGRSGHSGASGMKGRKDALAGAAEIIVEGERIANSPEGEGAVVTVGRIEVSPNAFNCIPDSVEFTVDIRHPDPEALQRVKRHVERRINGISGRRGLESQLECAFTPGLPLSHRIRTAIQQAASGLNLEWRTTPSWAMHDAGTLARITDVGMIFVPSVDGLSHNPGEFTEPGAIERGIDVLYAVVAGLAGMGRTTA